MIVVDFVCTEQEDGSQAWQRHWIRLERCQLCGGVDCLIGHGYYLRKPKGMGSGKGAEVVSRKDTGTVWIERWLDPHGEALQAEGPAQALLGASEHLLAWGKTRWAEAAGYGRNDRLRFLWWWSSGRRLGGWSRRSRTHTV